MANGTNDDEVTPSQPLLGSNAATDERTPPQSCPPNRTETRHSTASRVLLPSSTDTEEAIPSPSPPQVSTSEKPGVQAKAKNGREYWRVTVYICIGAGCAVLVANMALLIWARVTGKPTAPGVATVYEGKRSKSKKHCLNGLTRFRHLRLDQRRHAMARTRNQYTFDGTPYRKQRLRAITVFPDETRPRQGPRRGQVA